MNKKFKLIVVLAIAVVLVFSFTATSFAAASPIASGGTVSGLPDGVTATITNQYSPNFAAIVDKQIGINTATQYVAAILDITPSSPVPNGSYTITIPLAIDSASKMEVFRFNGKTWDRINFVGYSGGNVVATTPNFSLFAVVVTKGAAGGGSTATTSSKSPKTGQEENVMLFVLMAVLAVGAVYTGRKAIKASK